MDNVPYTVYEASQARADRRFRLMWVLIIVMLISLIGTNAGWIVYESQYEDTVISQELDAGDSGIATINDGVHIND